MVDNQRTTLNTPLDSFGTPADPPSENTDHRSTTRPADAGHVWGTPEQVKERLGGYEGGEMTTRPAPPQTITVKPQPPESIPLSEQRATEKAVDNQEQVSNVGVPDTGPIGNLQADMLPTAVASDADNTVGSRPYSPSDKAAAKQRTNVPSVQTADGQRPATEATPAPANVDAPVRKVSRGRGGSRKAS